MTPANFTFEIVSPKYGTFEVTASERIQRNRKKVSQ